LITSARADELAKQAHGSQRTKLGELFIDHVRRVASLVASDGDELTTVAALVHDGVEKGSLTWDERAAVGADAELLTILDALTERRGETADDYLCRCASHPVALRIKRAELEDKLQTVHPAGVAPRVMKKQQDKARRRLETLLRFAALPPRDSIVPDDAAVPPGDPA
jgi:(p)ppGpp synthase/HD superfamily hydrolase